MSGEISLAVPFDVEPPDHAPALKRIFPYPRMHGLAVPWDVARKTNIHRQKPSHLPKQPRVQLPDR